LRAGRLGAERKPDIQETRARGREACGQESKDTRKQKEKLSCLITSLARLKAVAAPEPLTPGSH